MQRKFVQSVTPRAHANLMVEFANNDALKCFIRNGELGGKPAYIYVDYPLWKADEEYILYEMSHADAVADRKMTLEAQAVEQAKEEAAEEAIASFQETVADAEAALEETLKAIDEA